ncbi:MAG: hypothetical protein ACLFPX_07285 [Candidatus Omnitrophota bacterium]
MDWEGKCAESYDALEGQPRLYYAQCSCVNDKAVPSPDICAQTLYCEEEHCSINGDIVDVGQCAVCAAGKQELFERECKDIRNKEACGKYYACGEGGKCHECLWFDGRTDEPAGCKEVLSKSVKIDKKNGILYPQLFERKPCRHPCYGADSQGNLCESGFLRRCGSCALENPKDPASFMCVENRAPFIEKDKDGQNIPVEFKNHPKEFKKNGWSLYYTNPWRGNVFTELDLHFSDQKEGESPHIQGTPDDDLQCTMLDVHFFGELHRKFNIASEHFGNRKCDNMMMRRVNDLFIKKDLKKATGLEDPAPELILPFDYRVELIVEDDGRVGKNCQISWPEDGRPRDTYRTLDFTLCPIGERETETMSMNLIAGSVLQQTVDIKMGGELVEEDVETGKAWERIVQVKLKPDSFGHENPFVMDFTDRCGTLTLGGQHCFAGADPSESSGDAWKQKNFASGWEFETRIHKFRIKKIFPMVKPMIDLLLGDTKIEVNTERGKKTVALKDELAEAYRKNFLNQREFVFHAKFTITDNVVRAKGWVQFYLQKYSWEREATPLTTKNAVGFLKALNQNVKTIASEMDALVENDEAVKYDPVKEWNWNKNLAEKIRSVKPVESESALYAWDRFPIWAETCCPHKKQKNKGRAKAENGQAAAKIFSPSNVFVQNDYGQKSQIYKVETSAILNEPLTVTVAYDPFAMPNNSNPYLYQLKDDLLDHHGIEIQDTAVYQFDLVPGETGEFAQDNITINAPRGAVSKPGKLIIVSRAFADTVEPDIACSDDADCGAPYEQGARHCEGSSVVQDVIQPTCVHAGTYNSYCQNKIRYDVREQCGLLQSCREASCIDPAVTLDPDGKDFYTRGITETDAGNFEDYCDGNTVVEYWREGAVLKSGEFACPEACRNGRCQKFLADADQDGRVSLAEILEYIHLAETEDALPAEQRNPDVDGRQAVYEWENQ